MSKQVSIVSLRNEEVSISSECLNMTTCFCCGLRAIIFLDIATKFLVYLWLPSWVRNGAVSCKESKEVQLKNLS